MNKTRLAPLSALTLGIITSMSSFATTYQVVEMPLSDYGRNSFADALNDSGDFIATLEMSTKYHPQIDVDLLNFDDTTLTDRLTNLNEVKNGTPNNDDLVYLFSALNSKNGSVQYQQFGKYTGYYGDNNHAQQLAGFDVIDPRYQTYMNSANTLLYGMNDRGWIVGSGSAPYSTEEYINSNNLTVDVQVRDFATRGFVKIGNSLVSLIPPEHILGGLSEARAVNDNFQIAGSVTTDATEATRTAEANCQDDATRGDQPLKLCLQNIQGAFKTRAAVWQLNSNGDIVDVKTYEPLAPPQDNSTSFLTSKALGINDKGIAVGVSDGDYEGNDILLPNYSRLKRGAIVPTATIYKDDKSFGFIDQNQYYTSKAVAINNHDLVIGDGTKLINGYARHKFFVYSIDNNEVLFPNDFFSGSDSVARDINDNDMVVGDGEVEAGLGVQRRRHGFIYNYDDQTFQDLNDLLPCGSPYTIVQANSINNYNEILATALVTRPLLDVAGQPLTNTDGTPLESEVTVTVKLLPIPGTTSRECSTPTTSGSRQGGSIGWSGLLMLTIMGLWRRRRQKCTY